MHGTQDTRETPVPAALTVPTVPAGIANTDQAAAWNGYEGTHWAAHQERWNAVNAGFDRPLLDAAAITPGERVLDIGCGGGATTRLAARAAGAGHALGLDLSGPVLEHARTRARREAVANIAFEQGDAQVHPLPPAAFDIAISRFGIMFFADPVAAFANIARALRPGGRVAFLSAAEPEGNEWLQALVSLRDILPVGGFGAPGGPGMFALADAATATALLTEAGFRDARAEHVRAYGTWGRDAGDAADFLLDSGPGRHLLAQVGPEAATEARARLTAYLGTYGTAGTAGSAESGSGGGGGLRLRSTGWLLTATRPA
ncbi:class I SAM-dependent methyltransferase [Streptomyces yaizuensis]|uniref:Class I SAM-dependent methyltransferase n=1 Tax=Streptomyces yaizuensis TaxID=2989713 RepID=A0ABQ5P9F0_9ACTN|nr:class I SAM-dependent methyltransferase [Streptomyces sp. YSPA8]GLF99182.1 class I SAM-dependent methyltransferase [Streptomyces sp. YSPA8]